MSTRASIILPSVCAAVFACPIPVRGDDPPADSRAVGTRRSTFAPVADKTGHAGLFVGVNVFPEENSLTSLNFAVNDAVCLAHLFVVELKLIQPDRATLALSGAPTGYAAAQLTALKAAGVAVTDATKIRVLRALQRNSRIPRSHRFLGTTRENNRNGVANLPIAQPACCALYKPNPASNPKQAHPTLTLQSPPCAIIHSAPLLPQPQPQPHFSSARPLRRNILDQYCVARGFGIWELGLEN